MALDLVMDIAVMQEALPGSEFFPVLVYLQVKETGGRRNAWEIILGLQITHFFFFLKFLLSFINAMSIPANVEKERNLTEISLSSHLECGADS